MVNYKEAKIYMIKSPNHDKVYIGSTTYPLRKRLQSHFKDLRRNKYCSAQDILNAGDYEISLVEEVICDNSTELKQRERFYIESLNTVNKNIPLQTKREWYQKNKDKIDKQRKERELKKKLENTLLQTK